MALTDNGRKKLYAVLLQSQQYHSVMKWIDADDGIASWGCTDLAEIWNTDTDAARFFADQLVEYGYLKRIALNGVGRRIYLLPHACKSQEKSQSNAPQHSALAIHTHEHMPDIMAELRDRCLTMGSEELEMLYRQTAQQLDIIRECLPHGQQIDARRKQGQMLAAQWREAEMLRRQLAALASAQQHDAQQHDAQKHNMSVLSF